MGTLLSSSLLFSIFHYRLKGHIYLSYLRKKAECLGFRQGSFNIQTPEAFLFTAGILEVGR